MKFTHKMLTAALSLSLLMPFAVFGMNYEEYINFAKTCNSSVALKKAYDSLDRKNYHNQNQFKIKFDKLVQAENQAAMDAMRADEVRGALAQRDSESNRIADLQDEAKKAAQDKAIDALTSSEPSTFGVVSHYVSGKVANGYNYASDKVANSYNWVKENPKKSVVIALGTGAAIYGGYKYRDAIKNNGSLVLGKGKDAVVYTKDCVTGSRPYNWVTSWFTKPEVKKTLTQKGLEKAKNIKNKAKNIKDGAKEGVKSAYNAVFKK